MDIYENYRAQFMDYSARDYHQRWENMGALTYGLARMVELALENRTLSDRSVNHAAFLAAIEKLLGKEAVKTLCSTP